MLSYTLVYWPSGNHGKECWIFCHPVRRSSAYGDWRQRNEWRNRQCSIPSITSSQHTSTPFRKYRYQ